MDKKIYIPLGIIVIIVVSLSVFYFLQQRMLSLDESVAVRPVVKEQPAKGGDVEAEVDLSKDLSDLSEIADDSDLAEMDSDLDALTQDDAGGEGAGDSSGSGQTSVDVSDLEGIDQSLSSELDDLGATISDLEGLGDDSSYSDLGTTLDDLLL